MGDLCVHPTHAEYKALYIYCGSATWWTDYEPLLTLITHFATLKTSHPHVSMKVGSLKAIFISKMGTFSTVWTVVLTWADILIVPELDFNDAPDFSPCKKSSCVFKKLDRVAGNQSPFTWHKNQTIYTMYQKQIPNGLAFRCDITTLLPPSDHSTITHTQFKFICLPHVLDFKVKRVNAYRYRWGSHLVSGASLDGRPGQPFILGRSFGRSFIYA